jgi:hypothetical protein
VEATISRFSCARYQCLNQQAGYLANAEPFRELLSSPCYLRRFVSWPAKTSAHDSTLGREVPVAFDLGLDGAQASVDPLLIMLRSNSKKAPVTWKSSLPVGVVASRCC